MSAQPTEPLPQQSPNDARLVATIVSLMAVGAPNKALASRVATLLRPVGVTGTAATLSVRLAMSAPIVSRQATRLDTPAVKATVSTEHYFRATYTLEAARRIDASIKSGTPAASALQEERRFFLLHRQAADRRMEMARKVDIARERFGDELGWYAKKDSRTTPECKAAHGKNFSALVMPRIGYPGTVHPRCRCLAGPPHKSGKQLAVRAA